MSNAFKCDFDILTNNDSGLAKAPRHVLCVHTFEGNDLNAQAMARYQQRPESGGSYHLVIDCDGKTARENDDAYIPWAARFTGNRVAYHVSLAGKAAFTRTQWLARPDQLAALARVMVAYSRAYDIPLVKLTPEQLRAHDAGLCGHVDISAAFHESTHTDPGTNFPWDRVIACAEHLLKKGNTTMSTPDVPVSLDILQDVRQQLTGSRNHDYPGWPQGGDRTLYDLVAAIAEKVGVPNTRDTKGS